MVNVKFWILDVNYSVVGGIPEIRMWGIDSEDRRVVVIDRSFRPYFYVLPEPGKEEVVAERLRRIGKRYKLLSIEVVDRKYFGEPVKALKVTCQIPAQIPDFREEAAKIPDVREVLEADIRFYMRYMIDH